MQENSNFIYFINEIETELEELKIDDCLNFFINKINENKEVINNEKLVREVCYSFLGKDKIFGSISKINDQLLRKTLDDDKSQLWIVYYLIYYSGQLYPYLYTRLLYGNILNKFVDNLNQIPINKNEILYQSILRICYKIVHLHKLSNKDLELFSEEIIETLLEFIEHTRNYHDENVNYSIIEFLVVLSNQIENKIKNRNKNNNKNIIKFNNIIIVLEKRINKSKTLSENLIFLLNRTDDFSVKLYILKFLYLIFSTPSLDKFFYTNDISVLLDVTIRELWNLTDEHTHVQKGYLLLLEKLIQYTVNYNIPYRYHDITKLLYAISERSKNTCYSNEIQHAKLVALSNIAQRIMNSFNSILKISTITPVSSNENLHLLNTKDSSISLSTSHSKKKEKSKKNKSTKIQPKSEHSSTSLTSVRNDMENENDNHFEQKKKKENRRRINPLNQIKTKMEDEDNNELIKEKEEENSNKKKDDCIMGKDHEGLSQKALDIFMKSNQQYHENNQAIQSEPPVIEESPLSPVAEYRDHDKLSQKAMNIFMKSYQQYNESNPSSEISTPSTRPTELDIESDYVPIVLSPPKENDDNLCSPIKENKDHDKLSEKAMNIFIRSYQQYHENNPFSENNNSSLISTSINNEEPPLSPIEEDRDHDKLSQHAMDIFMKSMQQYNNEQEVIHSSILPPTYTGIENASFSQSQQQETITTRDSDVLSYSSNSSISNNGFTIPSRYESLKSDPIERTQSPFSDNYQISLQYNYNYNKGRSSITNSNTVASPALSASSYQSNYSSSSNSTKPYTYYSQPKTNNIFKREKFTDNSTISPLNYGGRKKSYSTVSNSSSSNSPRFNYSNGNYNRINPLNNNNFKMGLNIFEDPIMRNQSPFDDSFSIE